MKKIMMIIVASILGVLVVGYFGGKCYLHSKRPDLNGNERIVSKALTIDGAPEDILGQVSEVTVTKDMGNVYLSIPVNNKKMESCRATLTYQENEIDQCQLTVSPTGYVTYQLENLAQLTPGLYSVSFFDAEDQINVYASIDLK